MAHTLSEHFIDHHQQFGNMSDSDVSEVESDISNEKQQNGNNIDENSNNNNNNNNFDDDDNGNSDRQFEEINNERNCEISNHINIRCDKNLSKIEEILRTVFESNSSHLRSAIETFTEHETDSESYWFTNQMETESDQFVGTNDNDFVDASTEIIACDLQTYLKRYDDEAGVNLDEHSIHKNCETLTPDESPPDIIQKSMSSENGFDVKTDKPDILQNVVMEQGELAGSTSLLSVQHDKDEPGSQWSITPVDIVGNFEQEVERELGLLINGYKSNKLNCSDGQTQLELDEPCAAIERRNVSEKVMKWKKIASTNNVFLFAFCCI